jgi:hypothetical protein
VNATHKILKGNLESSRAQLVSQIMQLLKDVLAQLKSSRPGSSSNFTCSRTDSMGHHCDNRRFRSLLKSIPEDDRPFVRKKKSAWHRFIQRDNSVLYQQPLRRLVLNVVGGLKINDIKHKINQSGECNPVPAIRDKVKCYLHQVPPPWTQEERNLFKQRREETDIGLC